MTTFIYGKNPILECLRANRRKIHSLYLSESTNTQEKAWRELLQISESKKIKIKLTPKHWFEQKFGNALTQFCAAEVEDYPYADFESLTLNLQNKEHSLILALDQIQDPQNLGAILRNAEGAGADAILLPERNSVDVTAAVCKAAAGAEEHLNIAQVTNLSRSLKQLKEYGFWVVGTRAPENSLEENSSSLKSQNIFDFDWPAKSVLVMGSEGSGMRRLTEETCDFWIYLPLLGKLQSLNVSATAAVCCYQYRGRFKLK